MSKPDPDEADRRAVEEVCQLLSVLNQELADAPRFKRGTPWWDDRVAARQRLPLRKQTLLNALAKT